MSIQNISESPIKSQEDNEMDFELVDDPVLEIETQIEIQGDDTISLEISQSSQTQLCPKEADEQKRFARTHLEVNGKKITSYDIKALIQEKKELQMNLDYTGKMCRVLKNQINDEKRKCRIQRQDFKIMHSLLQRYSEDQNQP